ncbi:unnamed protein product [Parajaminaea phylloscopi]
MKRLLAKAGGHRSADSPTPFRSSEQRVQSPPSPPALEPASSLSPPPVVVPALPTALSPVAPPYPSYAEEHTVSMQPSSGTASHSPGDMPEPTSPTAIDVVQQPRSRSTWARLTKKNQPPEATTDRDTRVSSLEPRRSLSSQGQEATPTPAQAGYQTYGRESYTPEGRLGARLSGNGFSTLPPSRSDRDHLSWKKGPAGFQSPASIKRGIWSGLRVSKPANDTHHDADLAAKFDISSDPRPKFTGPRRSRGASVTSGSRTSATEKAGFFWSDQDAASEDVDVDALAASVTRICSTLTADNDADAIFALAKTAAQSEAASKEAARAVRKAFKRGSPQVQIRAVRLWAMLMLYAAEHFRAHVAQRRFLEVLELVMTDPKTTQAVKDELLDVWAMFAHHYHKDAELGVIAKSFNRIRPADFPKNGRALDLSHPAFATGQADPPVAASTLLVDTLPDTQMSAQAQQRRSDSQPHLELFATTDERGQPLDGASDGNVSDRTSPEQVDGTRLDFAQEDDLHKVRADYIQAHVEADLLIEAVTAVGFASSEATECADRVLRSRELLLSHVERLAGAPDTRLDVSSGLDDWEHLERPQEAHTTHREPAVARDAETGQERRERLLASVFEALEQLDAAGAIYESARTEQEAQAEEHRVTELSKVDYRLDRSKVATDADTGYLYDETRRPMGLQLPSSLGQMQNASASSSSVHKMPAADPSPPTASRGITLPYAQPNTIAPSLSNVSAATNAPSCIVRSRPRHGSGGDGGDSSDDSSIVTPTQPSAKALGKRRAISRDDFDSDPAVVTAVATVANSLENITLSDSSSREARVVIQSVQPEHSNIPPPPVWAAERGKAAPGIPGGDPQGPLTLAHPSATETTVTTTMLPLHSEMTPHAPPALHPVPAEYRAEQRAQQHQYPMQQQMQRNMNRHAKAYGSGFI